MSMISEDAPMTPDVTICIPTWKSEPFIERTIECARNQTYSNVRIVISVDLCEDATAELCQKQAAEDSRIEVIVQPQRLGWSQNTNAAVEKVDTDFFFIYFHDDIIEPDYVATLLKELKARPDAASVHCDLVEFGLEEMTKPASPYEGSSLRRLVKFMMTQAGTTLRSLVRREKVGDSLRFPLIHGDNHWTAYVFHMLLLAAGPALAVNRPLYRRWQREGSLTRSRGWEAETLASLMKGQKESTLMCLEIIDRTLSNPDEIQIARHCLRLFQLLFIRGQQARLQDTGDISSLDLSPLLDPQKLSLIPGVLDREAESWVKDAQARLENLEATINGLEDGNHSFWTKFSKWWKQ